MTMNTNRIIELALVFFISLFSFSIGTFVGKKYSDNQHRLALLEPNKKTEERQAIDEAAQVQQTAAVAATQTEGEITDADVAKMAEEFSPENEVQAPVTTEVATEKPNQLNTIKTIAPETKDIKEVDLADSDDVESARDVASIPVKAKSMNTYTVQVGSYPTEDDANKMTDSLLARGYKANSIAATINGKTMYRVQVGLFNSLTEAQDYKKELMEKNRLSSAFVQKVKN